MSRWLDRPGYVAVAAFAAGAVVAALVLVLVVREGDGNGAPSAAAPSATAPPVGPTVLPATETPPGTPTPGRYQTPEDALAAYIQTQLNETYVGPCPLSIPQGQELPRGYCSIELYRSDQLATFNVGRYGTEALGEAVVTPNDDGTWSLVFLPFPRLDAAIQPGAEVFVFQAQDCLRFRAQPSTNAETLSCQLDGTRGRVIDGPVEADGHTWWQVEGFGWASAEFLAPVAE